MHQARTLFPRLWAGAAAALSARFNKSPARAGVPEGNPSQKVLQLGRYPLQNTGVSTHKVPQPPLVGFPRLSRPRSSLLHGKAGCTSPETGTESFNCSHWAKSCSRDLKSSHSWAWPSSASSPQVTEMYQKAFLSFSCTGTDEQSALVITSHHHPLLHLNRLSAYLGISVVPFPSRVPQPSPAVKSSGFAPCLGHN